MRKLWIIFSLIVILTGATMLVLTAKQSAQKDIQKDEATDIKRGVLTNDQKEHSKLYVNRRKGSRKLTELKDDELSVNVGSEFGSLGFSQQPSLNEFIRNAACGADAVVVATAQSKTSQMTPDELFIFSDYNLIINDVLRDSLNRLRANEDITVTRPGGKVRVDGRIIILNDRDEKKLEIGEQYLLFLRLIKPTGAFSAAFGSAKIEQNKLQSLSDSSRRNLLDSQPVQTAVDLIRNYLSVVTCSQTKEI